MIFARPWNFLWEESGAFAPGMPFVRRLTVWRWLAWKLRFARPRFVQSQIYGVDPNAPAARWYFTVENYKEEEE